MCLLKSLVSGGTREGLARRVGCEEWEFRTLGYSERSDLGSGFSFGATSAIFPTTVRGESETASFPQAARGAASGEMRSVLDS